VSLLKRWKIKTIQYWCIIYFLFSIIFFSCVLSIFLYAYTYIVCSSQTLLCWNCRDQWFFSDNTDPCELWPLECLCECLFTALLSSLKCNSVSSKFCELLWVFFFSLSWRVAIIKPHIFVGGWGIAIINARNNFWIYSKWDVNLNLLYWLYKVLFIYFYRSNVDVFCTALFVKRPLFLFTDLLNDVWFFSDNTDPCELWPLECLCECLCVILIQVEVIPLMNNQTRHIGNLCKTMFLKYSRPLRGKGHQRSLKIIY
jgi:hypothetical protein